MSSPQAPVRACGGGGRGDGGGGGGELADSTSTHSSSRKPPVKSDKIRMFSRLPRRLIDSYATSVLLVSYYAETKIRNTCFQKGRLHVCRIAGF